MDTHHALLKSARRMFAERGYAATSLEGLASSLGLTKAAVYHHFDSKRALLEALLEEGASESEQALARPGSLYERLLAVATAYEGQVEPLSALMTAQSGRRGGDQEAAAMALKAMQAGIERVAKVLEGVCPGHGYALAVTYASIVHGAYMTALHMPGNSLRVLLEEGIGVFVRGLPRA